MIEMPRTLTRFYEAMHSADVEALLSVLAVDFVGHVSEGLPEIGGTHASAQDMLQNAWLPAYRTYGVLPYPEDCIASGRDRAVVTGRYKGIPPATGQLFEAAFAHIFRLRDEQIAECWQITDSQRWVDAVAPEAMDVPVVRQVFDAVRTRDLDLLLDAYSDEIVINEDPALPYGGEFRGREGALAHSAGFASAWAPLQSGDEVDPEERILPSAGAPVAVWTLKGRRGESRIAQPASSHFEIREGKVVSLRMHYHDVGAIVRFLAG